MPHQEVVGAGGEQQLVCPHAAVLAHQAAVAQPLGLVEGGEDEAHVGEVRGPLEMVGLHTDCVEDSTGWLVQLDHVCSPLPGVDCKGWTG